MQILGVAPNPLPRQQLNQQCLTEAIQIAASNRSMKVHAASLGEIIRQEDGVNKTVALIEQIMS